MAGKDDAGSPPASAVTSAIQGLVADDGNQHPSDGAELDTQPQAADAEPATEPDPPPDDTGKTAGEDTAGTPPSGVDEADDGEDGEDERPLEDAIDDLSGDPDAQADDSPEAAAQDDEWRARLKPKTQRRFDRLLAERDEARTKLAEVEEQAKEHRDVVDMYQQLREANLAPEEIETGHAIMHALKNEPQTGVQQVWDYLQGYAQQAGIDLSTVVGDVDGKQPAQPEQAQADQTPDEDLDMLVEEGLISQTDVAAIKAARKAQTGGSQPPTTQGETAGATATPPQPPNPSPAAQAQAGPTATDLVAGFLAEQGVQTAQMADIYSRELAPEMLRMVQEDGVDVSSLSPRQQLRYAQLAWAAKKPAPKTAKKPKASKADQVPQDVAPGGGNRSGAKKPQSRVQGLIQDLAYGE